MLWEYIGSLHGGDPGAAAPETPRGIQDAPRDNVTDWAAHNGVEALYHD